MYIRVKEGVVVKYPYSWTDLRNEYPNVSFSLNMKEEDLKEFGVYVVKESGRPEINYDQKLVELQPIFEDGDWIKQWRVDYLSDEEIEAKIELRWSLVRSERDQKLSACDWTQLPDVVLTNAEQWKAYRQELRDITNAPNPFDIVFPEPPTA